jgi:hypothetical protein
MSTTSAYGWNIPDNTDLVKDGALAIRTLGNAIDTSMNTALGTKKAGMVLLSSLTFSGVTSQSINDVFSSTYDNYRIVLRINSTAVANANTELRMRVGGADNTTSNWYAGGQFAYVSGASGVLQQSAESAYILTTSLSTSTASFVVADILSPNLNVPTGISSMALGQNTTNYLNFHKSGFLNLTTQFTGFSLINGTMQITGNVSVYGYNK